MLIMAYAIQVGILVSIGLLGLLLGLHTRFAEGLTGTLAVLSGLLVVIGAAGTALGVWLAQHGLRAPRKEQELLRAAEEKVHHLARHDALTGLPNRGVFLERLNAALLGGRRGDRMTAVHCMDLADFKAVNDTLGYAAGDLLLRHMSARLLASLRESRTPWRAWGPDEFAIIQTDLEVPDRRCAAMASVSSR